MRSTHISRGLDLSQSIEHMRDANKKSKEGQSSSNVFCIIPSLSECRDFNYVQRVNSSHKWQLIKSEPNGKDVILYRVRCSVCGLERISIIYGFDESIEKKRAELEKRA